LVEILGVEKLPIFGFVGGPGRYAMKHGIKRSTAQLPEHQKFEIFSKCLENSKSFQDYYSKVGDYEYLLDFVILYCCFSEITD